MMISARNQIDVTVEEIQNGPVSALAVLKTALGGSMVASITNASASQMRLKAGDRVIAFFQASHVLIATGWALPISARNKLSGTIASLVMGTVNTEVCVRLGEGDRVTAVITNEAARDLALKEGDEVVAIIKASDVMIAK